MNLYRKQKLGLIIPAISLVAIFIILISFGPVSIPFSSIGGIITGDETVDPMLRNIFWQLRLPKALTALLAGSALAVSGLIMQTFFQNPLAGPFVLGIHSGSALGVALWTMASGTLFTFLPNSLNDLGSTLFAVIGSTTVLTALMILSIHIPGKIILLVMGLMFGYLAGGIINIMVAISDAHKIKIFLLWTLGSFERVSGDQLLIFSCIIVTGLLLTAFSVKQLNILLLGDRYAKSLGLSMMKIKLFLIFITALLAGTVTAFCGPVIFLGIVAPHLARKLTMSSDHRILLPAVIMLGAFMAMLAELISSLPGNIVLPLNAILGLMSIPIIFVFLWNHGKSEQL